MDTKQNIPKVYFAGAIRGGREDADLYKTIISYIEKYAVVLTKHVGDLSLRAIEGMPNRTAEIYRQDIEMLETCDLVIAECTTPSLGVGYELAYAEKLHKPCFLFYRKSKRRLSAMLLGNPYFSVTAYTSEEELYEALDKLFLTQWGIPT